MSKKMIIKKRRRRRCKIKEENEEKEEEKNSKIKIQKYCKQLFKRNREKTKTKDVGRSQARREIKKEKEGGGGEEEAAGGGGGGGMKEGRNSKRWGQQNRMHPGEGKQIE